MDKERQKNEKAKLLRIEAEKRHRSDTAVPERLSNDEIKRLVHELQVHQIELEMQNDELRNIQDKLEESLRRYTDLYDFGPIGYFTLDEDGLIVEVNLAGAAQLGKERRLLIGTPFRQFIIWDSQDEFYLHLKRVFDTRERQVSEVRLMRVGGVIFFGRLESIARQGSYGDYSRSLTVLIDITEKKKAEDEIQKLNTSLETQVSERTAQLEEANSQLREEIDLHERAREDIEMFRNLINRSIDGVVVVDPQTGRFLDVNDTMCEIMGYSRRELLDMRLTDIESGFPDEAAWNGHVRELREKGQMRLEREHKRKDGSLFFLEINTMIILLGSKEFITAIVRDVTERKRIEGELEKVQRLESLGILAGGIAHDFNNLLTGILGNISLAKMYLKPEDKAFKKLEESERSFPRARDLTHQLLTFSKGGSPVTADVSLDTLLTNSVAFALSGSDIRPEFSIPDDLWTVSADEGQINQVISNIVINAKQAMPEGGAVRISCRNVSVGAETSLPLKEGRYVMTTIEDHGTGIPEAHLQKIFDPYFTTKEMGKGLGLAICYSIIRRHGGYISVESRLGSGTAFHVYLPAALSVNSINKKEQEEKVFAGKGRVLVMDDEAAVINVASEMLRSLGYEAEAAGDGTEAIRMYVKAKEAGRPFDAVIFDLTIPGGMGGVEAIGRLKEIDPAVRAIVSSGYSNDPVIANYSEYGFCGRIIKPYQVVELARIMHEVIDR